MFTEESFFYVCKQAGLTMADLEDMNIGQCLDFIQEWVENNDKDGNSKVSTRKATQDDFNNF